MNNVMLKLLEVKDAGDLSKERVLFEAVEDVDIGDYVLTDTTYGADGTRSNKLRHVFEFPTRFVELGEFVRVFTKAGKVTKSTMADDFTPVHNLYWGLKETIWNKTGDQAFLLFAPKDERQSVIVPEQE